MYASVDSGVAAIERQIRRNKKRLEKRLARARSSMRALRHLSLRRMMPMRNSKSYAASIFPSSLCRPEEAILQMNLLGHEFFVFRNMDADDAISVVYQLQAGRLRPDLPMMGFWTIDI